MPVREAILLQALSPESALLASHGLLALRPDDFPRGL